MKKIKLLWSGMDAVVTNELSLQSLLASRKLKILKSAWMLILISIIGIIVIACDNETDGDSTPNPCANGHAFPEWTAPTCTADGNSVRACTRSGCDATDPRTTGYEKLSHTVSNWSMKTAADCITPEIEKGTCTVCEEEVSRDSATNLALGHSWNWEITILPGFTAETDGEETGTCSTCSTSETRVYKFYKIGDTGPAGGIIFYVADNTDGRPDGITIQGYGNSGDNGYFAEYTAYYLEAAPENASASIMHWSNTTVLIPNLSQHSSDTTDRTIGRGRLNTALINATHTADTAANNAAKAALAYTNGGKDDWFLPSREELNQMYIQRSHVSITTGYFWSSSQRDTSDAWDQYFTTGEQSNYRKNSNLDNVRAIRAF